MKYRYYFFLVMLPFLFGNCTSFKKGLSAEGSYRNVIENAIIDFSHSSRLFKRDSVFSVSLADPYHSVVIKETVNGYWESPGEPYDGIIAVSILTNYNKFLEADINSQEKGGVKMPTQYLQVDGRLFYWRDSSEPLTPETLKVFRSFDLLLPNTLDGVIEAAESGEYVSSKAEHYFFCKKNIRRYKRVTSKIALGYYDLPRNVICD